MNHSHLVSVSQTGHGVGRLLPFWFSSFTKSDKDKNGDTFYKWFPPFGPSLTQTSERQTTEKLFCIIWHVDCDIKEVHLQRLYPQNVLTRPRIKMATVGWVSFNYSLSRCHPHLFAPARWLKQEFMTQSIKHLTSSARNKIIKGHCEPPDAIFVGGRLTLSLLQWRSCDSTTGAPCTGMTESFQVYQENYLVARDNEMKIIKAYIRKYC